MKHTVRTFVAVEINAAVRQQAEDLIGRLRGAGVDVKWVDPGNLHLTVKFLGDVPSREIPRVCEAVAKGAAAVEPFELEVRGAGAFPNIRRPRTLWLGAGDGESQMIVLHGQIERPLQKLGFRSEHRRYHSHLTLGRVRSGGPNIAGLAELLQTHADYEAGRVKVSQVVVFSSLLGSGGPTYEVLSRAKLSGG